MCIRDRLQALLSKEEVSWRGEHYQFDSLTIMPRPLTPGGPQMMMAVLNPEGVYHCTKRGFHIQTTPLASNHQLLLDQVESFGRAKAEMGASGSSLSLSLSRVGLPCASDSQIKSRVRSAENYYARFDNVFTGPGRVSNCLLYTSPSPRDRTRSRMPSSA